MSCIPAGLGGLGDTDAMAIGLRVQELVFSGAVTPIDVADADVIVLIGPNNAGKSRALREIEARLSNDLEGSVVTGMTVERIGTQDELVAHLQATTPLYRADGHLGTDHRILRSGGTYSMSGAAQTWTHGAILAGGLAEALVFRANAEARLALANSVASVDIIDGQPREPLQRLIGDPAAEARLAEKVRSAFGEKVLVNRAGGATVHLHVGSTETAPLLGDAAYIEELRALPLVPEQGDGMRSFVGLMLALEATPYPLVLIDEPEAFLHPPQARQLGRELGRAGAQQRVISTHSSDVLLGLVENGAAVSVIRLQREGNVNAAAVLNQARISELWSDSSLRYSNLLSGLFHSGVVVTEADGDARLYGATADHVRAAAGRPTSDFLFTHCGGKHRLPLAIETLRPMGVPVAAIADIDVLRNEALLERIVVALGGSWEEYRADWIQVDAAIKAHPIPAPKVFEVQEKLTEALGSDPAAPLSEAQSRAIRKLTKVEDGWKSVRASGGKSAFPSGHATATLERLIEHLSALGLFVVPVGALEGWARSIGGHGPTFVQAALEARVHETQAELRGFVSAVESFLGLPRSEGV